MRQYIYSAWIIINSKGTEEVQTAISAPNKTAAEDSLKAQGHIVTEISRHCNPEWAKSFYNL